MFNNVKIGVRLALGFGTVMLLMLSIIIASIYGFRNTGRYMHEVVNDRFPKVEKAADTLDKINIVARSSFGVLLTDSKTEIDKDLERITKAMQAIDKNVDALGKSAGTEEGRDIYNAFIRAKQEYDPAMNTFVALMMSGRIDEAKRLRLVDIRKMQRERYMPAIENIIKYEEKMTKQAGSDAEAAKSRALTLVIAFALSAMLLSFILGVLITRSISGPLKVAKDAAERVAAGDLTVNVTVDRKDEIGELNKTIGAMIVNLQNIVSRIKEAANSIMAGSEELSSNSSQITRGMSEQTERASQIATASAEMSQTVLDIAKNASSIAASSSTAQTQSDDGELIVRKTAEEVQDIAQTVSIASQLIKSLGARSTQIGEIVNVIKDIADQTNLLALNAAIEAARAGEQGRGFAVVADEVRKLAEKTSKATTEIGGMITTIQNETEKAVEAMAQSHRKVAIGVDLSKQAGGSLKKITESIHELQLMVHQIATATEEMAAVSETISSDIEGVASVSKDTLASAEQIVDSSTNLSRLASGLKEIVKRFKL
ncbi:MAG: methyl-accepting chemotaxis protein [Nitrospirae bacterium]|nr:methyl-accepting chemotaxis protein [Nitrospirota bacterium]